MEIVLDEKVSEREGVQSLGIMEGDIVAFDPRTRSLKADILKAVSWMIKRAGILLGYARYLKEAGICPTGKSISILLYMKKWDMEARPLFLKG